MIAALTVGRTVFDLIDREPKIINSSVISKEITLSEGIKFEKVKFKYPTAPEAAPYVFTGSSFTIKTGTSTAIVGPSGSGKSTIVQLLNRLYDPEEGSILYGNENIKELDLIKLRDLIGYVG